MPTVCLQKDSTENISQVFNLGEHIIGRGNKLKCNSKKISRNHGLLKVTNEGIFLRSTHNNPCFFKPNSSTDVTVLTFGNTIQINDNDKIALSLEHGWFIVQIKNSEDSTNNDEGNQNLNNITGDSTNISRLSVKRENDTEIGQSVSKKLKSDETSNIPQVENVDSAVSNENIVIKTEPLDITTANTSCSNNSEINVTIKQEETEEIPLNNLNTVQKIKTEIDIKEEENDCEKENDNEGNNDKPSTSGTTKRPWRDRCWYGSSCYRKNCAHRVEFKHPGDSDFDSDPEDSRPICCYGVNCYRKNREHRKRYRHPGQTKLGDRPAPTPNKRRKIQAPKPMSQDSEELDSYDLFDPFIDDGSSDEYEPTEISDTESEYEDSQEVVEDNKRLLKEARKFTNNK